MPSATAHSASISRQAKQQQSRPSGGTSRQQRRQQQQQQQHIEYQGMFMASECRARKDDYPFPATLVWEREDTQLWLGGRDCADELGALRNRKIKAKVCLAGTFSRLSTYYVTERQEHKSGSNNSGRANGCSWLLVLKHLS